MPNELFASAERPISENFADMKSYQGYRKGAFARSYETAQSFADRVADVWLYITGLSRPVLYGLVTALSLIIGLMWVAITPTSYEATAVLGAVEETGGNQTLSGLTQSLESNVLGVSLGANNVAESFGRFQEILTSTYLVNVIEKKYHIADLLDIPRNNSGGGGIIADAKDAVKYLLGVPRTRISRIEQLTDAIRGGFGVTPQLQTQTLEVTFTAKSPELASKILNIFIKEDDDVLKQRAAVRAGKEVGYMTEELNKQNEQALRQTLYSSVVTSETKYLMASSELPYSVDILDGPYASSKPAWPRPTWQIGVVFVIFQVLYLGMFGYRYLLPNKSIYQDENSRPDLS